MILGRIVGKLSTTNFEFLVEGDAKKFQYCQVYHKDYDYVLCQIVELIKDSEKTIATCNVIGYREENRIKQIRTPFEPNTEILRADDDFIRKVIQLDTKESAYIGMLEGRDIPIYLDLNKLLSKHIAIIAKSGSGKSYAAAVLIEEIIEKKVPLLIIDPHGEYSCLKQPSENKEELQKFNLMPTSYLESVQEYGNMGINHNLKPLLLNNNISPEELVHLLPTKLSSNQQALLYSILSETPDTDFDTLLLELHRSNNNAKFNVINAINYLKQLNIFSSNHTPYNELILPGKCTIINLKGVEPEIQEIIVYKLLKDLFEERKKENLPPFFCIVEEAHNFCVAGDSILSTNHGFKEISKVNSDKLMTYNHSKNEFENMDIIENWPKRKAFVFEILSESGRSLRCTLDHPLYHKGSYINAQSANYFSVPVLNNYNMNKKIIEARLMGALFSDGWVSINKQVGFSGKYQDMKTIKRDLEILKIKSSCVYSFKNKNPSQVRKKDGKILKIKGEGSSVHCSTNAFRYFSSLGAIVGEKVSQESIIPGWILHGSKDVKAEFLAGLMGGDGDNPIPYGLNFYAIRLYLSKVDELEDSALKYARNIMELFKELNVQTNLSTRIGNIRKKDGKKTTRYIISINNEDSNLINFFENVGYRYNLKKEKHSKQALIYLKIKKLEILKKERLRKKALELKRKKGWGKVKIARQLGTSPDIIKRWIYKLNKSDELRLSRVAFPNFKKWVKHNCDDNFIYENIIRKKQIGEDFVYNLTTNNQNYVVNGILVHNCPERGYGEATSSKILRTISSEGRKFGLGLCFITQRPSRIEKNALSQCTTQIILKVTNPNDLRAISSSVEGITSETENEVVNLPIGTAMITGIVDLPLFVTIRPRKTKHGGEAVNMLDLDEIDVLEETKKFQDKNLLSAIRPKITLDEIKLSSDREINSITTYLIPIALFNCVNEGNQFNLLMDLVKGEIITDIGKSTSHQLPKPEQYSSNELNIIKISLKLNEFTENDLINNSPLDPAITKHVFNSLLKKDIFDFRNGRHKISDSFNLLFNPEKLASYEKLEFANIPFNHKIEKKLTADELKCKLNHFVSITNYKEGFVVYHKVEYI